jgi:GxxExxY protein
MQEQNLLLKDEVYAVVGAAIEVHREMGCGFFEAAYQEAMELEMAERGIPYLPQQLLKIRYKRWVLKKEYVADFICFGGLLIEIKALDRLTSKEEAQVLNYLKATGFEVAVLINFGAHGRLEWKRLVRTQHGVIDPDETDI